MLGTSAMNRGGPLSPVSSEWSGISKYQGVEGDTPPSPGGPYSRGNLVTPPISTASTGMMNGGGLPPKGAPDSPGNPSPPASIARSSIGTGLYAGSESGRSRGGKDETFEAVLSEHYVALKRYLAASLRDEKGNPRPNRARDKLLRLSSVQFQELSTDVFDELLRRQAGGRKTPNGGPVDGGPPPYLLPKDSFHPKRNQARQKLSTLPPPRFRDLATDVFYELERRFPRFAAGDISRIGSPASVRGPQSRTGTPVNGMPRPGSRGNDRRRPSDASSLGYPPRGESRNGMRPPMGPNGALNIPPSPGIPPGDFGRPTPKTFQSNTIVPVTSTMVEDDDDQTGGEDDDDDGDAFGLESAARSRESKRSEKSTKSDTDKNLIDDYQLQVAELREKVESMEDMMKLKDDELSSAQETLTVVNNDKSKWSELRTELENKLADAQTLNESLQSELDKVREEHSHTEQELRADLDELRASSSNSGPADEELKQENEDLRMELEEQREVTEEVRREAQDFLREMRILSERSGSSWEKEQQLENHVLKLEDEVKEWRERYAKTKTQLRSMRGSSIGLKLQQDASKLVKDSGFTDENGAVKDVHVTKFQISIDELLQTARSDEPDRVIQYMKNVVNNVRRILQDIEEAPSRNPELSERQTKLKSRVSATANNLITASKNFAGAKGLSPISLLDAAASHLTAAIIDFVRAVKIRPTPAGELGEDEEGVVSPGGSTGFFPVQQNENDVPAFYGLRNGHQSIESSTYSPVNSPRESTMRPKSSGKSWKRPESKPPMPNGLSVSSNGLSKALPPPPISPGFGMRQGSDVEDLKIYLEDQTALLVQTIQTLVSSIRSEAGINALTPQIDAIGDVVNKIVGNTESTMSQTSNNELRLQADPVVKKLAECRQRILDMADEGERIADGGGDDEDGETGEGYRKWAGRLPPIAFEIARETKELVQRVDTIDAQNGGDGEDFS